MLTEVLHQRPGRLSWLVGETKAERVERMNADAETDFSQWYQNSYPRRVVSVRSVADVDSGKLPTLRNMAGDFLRVRIIDMSEEERQGAANRTLKVQGNRLVPVTFDDRFGAVAVKLRERHSDPEAWERDEALRVKTEEAANDKQRADYDRALEEYRVLMADFPVELHKWSMADDGTPPAFPERPKAIRLREVVESSFEREANAIARALAPTVTATGTGLYFTKETPTQLDRTQSGAPVGQTVSVTVGGLGTADAFIGGYITNVTRSETRAIVSHIDDAATLEGGVTTWADTDDLDIFDAWSTIQAALDQLFTDQGSALFTASQYVRVFAGTYDENIVPNGGFLGQSNEGWGIVLEGDPSTDRANISVSPSGGAWGLINIDTTSSIGFVLRHMSFAGTPSAGCVLVGALRAAIRIFDCVFAPANAGTNSVVIARNTRIEDCVLSRPTGSSLSVLKLQFEGCGAYRCVLPGVGTSEGSTHAGIECNGSAVIEGCTIANFPIGIDVTGASGSSPGLVRASNNTIYNCLQGLKALKSAAQYTLINNIFRDCVTVLTPGAAPEVTATLFGPAFVLRNNNYSGYTTFADDGSTTYTHSEFTALNLCDEDGDKNNVDPLLTDPATGDFSLQAASPAKWAGHGSGVVTGINDVALDPFHPDIGAWSSGLLVVTAPAITATDLLNQSDVRVDVVADNPFDVSTIFYQTVPGGVLQTWINTVTGSGSETITGLLVKPYVIYAEADRGGVNSLASNLVFLNVVAADQYTAIRNALREWVKSVVGNPEVIWRDGNAPQPTRQYVSIHMGPSTVVGSDYHSNADSSGVETVRGDREFVFGIQIHGQPAQEDGSASISILERIRSSLEKRTIQATLRVAGLAFVADEGFGDLAGIGGTEFEARVFRDLRFRITYRDTDDVGFIGTATAPVATYD